MGCSASRPETLLCRNQDDRSSSSPSFDSTVSQPRALSLPMPLVHHPPLRKGDTHHLVSLTSTTYGSLLLIDAKSSPDPDPRPFSDTPTSKTRSLADSEDSPSPDSVINTWELMDGLDDADFDSSGKSNGSSNVDRPLVFRDKPSSCRKRQDSFELVEEEPSTETTKPLWKHLSEEALLAKMDPNVIYSYMRALSSRHSGSSQNESFVSPCADEFHSKPMGAEDDRILLYFTSLRGIRKTYEDCCAVRMMLRSFRVPVDERDISMDSSLRKELEASLAGRALTLPQVFIRGKHVGGADEMKQLDEAGELVRLLDGFPTQDPGLVCETCGGARFVPCSRCDGSRKVFDEHEDRLRRCLDCNENGLIRCPSCCL
ncbi:hypothetical protein SAY86_005114 [Trapa natans]|uniref:Glutaredoxin domain-containing protein n=1 Tax=Trapa natans TaxID=22666 RepID=A0AAN7L083_TRANT|nr:hypothetical protein SAY86_005114 [Trapa natans]